MKDFRLPNDTHRLAIIGRNGTGKTQAGVWHLTMRSFDKMPWIVFNFKNDELINSIPGTTELDVSSRPPKEPGIYIMRVLPDEKEEVDAFLMKVWEKERIGLFVDEGYILTGLKGFRRVLTQGRSKHIPMIILSQRPVFMDRFTWTESNFFQIFNVSINDDKKSIASYIGGKVLKRLPDYHSFWYDVGSDQISMLRPVPDEATLVQTFRSRMPTKRRII